MAKDVDAGQHEKTMHTTLDTIRAQQPESKAVTRMLDDTAMVGARYCDALSSAGGSIAPLHGFPTSLQIVVRRLDDPVALRIGHAFEQVCGTFPKPSLGQRLK